jgi:DNA-binding NarL/FixJ family response regulator
MSEQETMQKELIRVVLADDHSAVRRGIRDFLTEAGDIVVVGEAETGTQAHQLTLYYQPDVAVLDVQMPDGNGLEAAKHLRQDHYQGGILILTAFDDPPYIRAALEAGANGYVLKSSQADEIVEAVHSVFEGKQVFDARLSITSITSTLSDEATQLTERERDVLQLAAQGLTNKAIGFKLSISDRTVQGHLANIYVKLGAASRTEAVTKAVSLREIEVPHA